MSEFDCATQWRSLPVGTYTEARKGWVSENTGLCMERAAWFQEVGWRQKARHQGSTCYPVWLSGVKELGFRAKRECEVWLQTLLQGDPASNGSLSAAVLAMSSEPKHWTWVLSRDWWLRRRSSYRRCAYVGSIERVEGFLKIDVCIRAGSILSRGPSTSIINDPIPVCMWLCSWDDFYMLVEACGLLLFSSFWYPVIEYRNCFKMIQKVKTPI